ncbi:sigma-70 family RNA polymerase sigma factor [Dactylosporangium sp. NPDC005572]|uniref:RNA polymerase sigma factor n=1 Tax=Dactylosporangium sp. NPDC005572 TaxID=3156889 RepID=UPI0033AC69C5
MIDNRRRSVEPHEVGLAPPDFTEFYVANAARVLHAMTAFAGADLAREAVAESFARILERWAGLAHLDDAQRRAYVLTTAKNYVRRHALVSARFAPLPEESGVGGDDPALDEVADRLSLERAVRALIDGQPVRRRQVALLYFLHDDSYAEIASYLDITESTVRSHVAEVRRLLQPYVRRYQSLTEASDADRPHA